MSGTLRDMYRLPRRYHPLQATRIVTWTLSPVIPFLAVLAFIYPAYVPQHGLYQIASIGLFSMLFVFMIAGLLEYRKIPEVWPVYLVLTPLVVTLHAIGAFWGLLRPATDFKITQKTPGRVDVETLMELNPNLDAETVEPSEEPDAESAEPSEEPDPVTETVND